MTSSLMSILQTSSLMSIIPLPPSMTFSLTPTILCLFLPLTSKQRNEPSTESPLTYPLTPNQLDGPSSDTGDKSAHGSPHLY